MAQKSTDITVIESENSGAEGTSLSRNISEKYRCAYCKQGLADRKEFEIVKKRFEKNVLITHQILSKKEQQRQEILLDQLRAKYRKKVKELEANNEHSLSLVKRSKESIRALESRHKEELKNLKKHHQIALEHERQMCKVQILAAQQSMNSLLSDQLKTTSERYSKLISEYKKDTEKMQAVQERYSSLIRDKESELELIRIKLAANRSLNENAPAYLQNGVNSTIISDSYDSNSHLAAETNKKSNIPPVLTQRRAQRIKMPPLLPSPTDKAQEAQELNKMLLGEASKENLDAANMMDERKIMIETKQDLETEEPNKYKEYGNLIPSSSMSDVNKIDERYIDTDLKDASDANIANMFSAPKAASIKVGTPPSFSPIAPSVAGTDDLDSVISPAEVEIKKGIDLVREGFYSDAHLSFEKAVKTDSSNSKGWYNLGLSHANLTKNYAQALSCFAKALEIEPGNAEAWNNKGAMFALLGRDEEAMLSYTRALEIVPNNAKPWMNMMFIYERHGNKKAAKECFRKSIEASLHI